MSCIRSESVLNLDCIQEKIALICLLGIGLILLSQYLCKNDVLLNNQGRNAVVSFSRLPEPNN